MKYIRTKDGKIIDLKNREININACYDIVFEDNTYISGDDIIEQADTIKELCDEFVIIRKDDISMGGELNTLKEMLLLRDYDIEFEVEDDYFYYGAIWTDKGLIYVAKMNEKGELELL